MADSLQRRGGLQIDPAVKAFQEHAATNRAVLTPKQKRERQRTRLHIDVDRELKEALMVLANKEHADTSLSQAAEILLTYGLQAWIQHESEVREAFQEDRTPAHTLRFGWNIEIPERWTETIASFLGLR